MAYGMTIRRSDGKFFASPDFTPFNLVQVIDYTIPGSVKSTIYIQTTVPNFQSSSVFWRYISTTGGMMMQIVAGANGYKQLKIDYAQGNGGNAFAVRFYIFGGYVAYNPPFGLSFWRGGVMVYAGNCLPLTCEYVPWTTGANTQGVPMAVMPGFHSAVAGPGVPGSGGSQQFILLSWAGSPTGVSQGTWWDGLNTGGLVYPDQSRGIIAIRTAIYDQYYIQSLGY
ncbi:hypothetical protein [Candidatus Pantoea multigeneris]|uniref:Uncharacterized protein n=1 Tax=Candidatus Pantoea multigeneris TaxID=2608357 RepID=A0ABX0R8V4_9GAMM|nr:hypothetical protein [Pantoea multigeneris]NIF20568.1 hypothetical protein [Pantoea multigeneris]